MTDKNHQATTDKSSKTERHFGEFLAKTVTCPPEQKNQKNKTDTPSCSTNEEETPAIVIDEESKCFCSLISAFYIKKIKQRL